MSAATPSLTEARPLLQAEGLGCVRGGRRVLREIALSLAPGELVLVTGPNGSGKTTLLRCLAGLLAPSEGTIGGAAFVPGQVLHLGHADPVKGHLTVAENLRFWAALSGGGGREPADAAAMLGLAVLANMPAYILSAGQRRRLSLARLLLSPAMLWLLDEPANALDSEGVACLLAAVAEHRATGGGAVVATHDALPFPAPRRLGLTAGGAAC